MLCSHDRPLCACYNLLLSVGTVVSFMCSYERCRRSLLPDRSMRYANQGELTAFPNSRSRVRVVWAVPTVKTIVLLTLLTTNFSTLVSRGAEPSPTPGDVRRGLTLYVSKLGDNSDGQSWKTAFHTIQQALDAVPDEKGGHQIIMATTRKPFPASSGIGGTCAISIRPEETADSSGTSPTRVASNSPLWSKTAWGPAGPSAAG